MSGPVATRSGPVVGVATVNTAVTAFKGIPYAASTSGAARWRPPQPHAPWRQPLRADHFGARCPQAPSQGDTQPAQDLPTSEDCLFLNVWTPARARGERLPVMVWVHGGAFINGSGASYGDAWADASSLAAQGVVLVTVNHRLGIFGYFVHPDLVAESPHHSAGNYGLLDVIAALRWVHENIAEFGGDPANVTLFGHSSGSGIVTNLLAVPQAAGLMQRAIAEGGGSMFYRAPRTMQWALQDGVRFAHARGAATLAQLRAQPADSLVTPQPGEFEPVVDGWVYPRSLFDTLAARDGNEVPLLIGSNSDEAQPVQGATVASYLAEVHKRYGTGADQVLAAVPARTDADAPRAFKGIDMLEAEAIHTTLADLADCAPARDGLPRVYQYHFDHTPPASAGGRRLEGAFHGAELPYVFHAIEGEARAWTSIDRHLEQLITGYWLNFARTGDVNGPGLPHWPTLREQPGAVMHFSDDARLGGRVNMEGVALLQRIYYGRTVNHCH
ncbi:MAG TPA: carboxylesterase family protein [Steroidobacteraceae bacterium]|nr:carboxylesterase family protein [Steroidobacteraceae bacterium]